jgi:hypothetical protein
MRPTELFYAAGVTDIDVTIGLINDQATNPRITPAATSTNKTMWSFPLIGYLVKTISRD